MPCKSGTTNNKAKRYVWVREGMGRRNTDTVTIKDISQACGVSISTVSNVLNGKTNKVSAAMAQKILEEVQRTGYRPNYLAKNLRASSTKTLGVIAEDLIVFSTPSIIEGIMSCCEEQGYSIVIENMRLFGRWHGKWLHDDKLFYSALTPVLSKMDSMNLDGILYVGGHEHKVDKLVSADQRPSVMAYSSSTDQKIPSFRLDDVSGGYDVIKYLVSMGHKKIGVIAGDYENVHTENRVAGIQKAMFEEGILFDPEAVIYGEWTKEHGAKAVKQLLKKKVTAVFCMSDMIAAGAYSYLLENGIMPGKDISVMGFDNQEISDFLTPAVSTMALPLEEIGYQAAGKLIRMIADPEKEGKEKTDIRIKSTLIERRSVARIG